jgi:hypothetical protein
VADLDRAMDALPEQTAQGFATFCVRPSQSTDAPHGVAALCRRVIRRADALAC